jgi:hypothetical protein
MLSGNRGAGVQHIILTRPALGTTALHCTALHCTALHCTALHCTALHCTALHGVRPAQPVGASPHSSVLLTRGPPDLFGAFKPNITR